MSTKMEAAHIIVSGRVQGVWFRASAQSRASELNLAGWVKNLSDGRVEIHAEGDRDHLDRFIDWCREGPPAAEVNDLDVSSVSPEGMNVFQIR